MYLPAGMVDFYGKCREIYQSHVWNLSLEMRSTTGGVRECCVFHRFFSQSFVSCQALAEALNQNSALPHLKLFNENIGPEGAKAWCLVRMVSWGERGWRNCKRRIKTSFVWKWHIRKCRKAMQLQYWWKVVHPGRLTWNIIMEVWFRSFSFLFMGDL